MTDTLEEGWELIFQHRVFCTLLNITEYEESDDEDDAEAIKHDRPYFFMIVVKVWPAFMIDKKANPTGIMVSLDCGEGDTLEEIRAYAHKIWAERIGQEWYANYIAQLKDHVRPKFLSLIADFRNLENPQ